MSKTMKTFADHRSHKELLTHLKGLGITVKTREYKRGSDYVSFEFTHDEGHGTCVTSTWNGKFFGTFYPNKYRGTSSEISFTSDDPSYDRRAWMKFLLGVHYIEEPSVLNGRDRTTSGAIGQP